MEVTPEFVGGCLLCIVYIYYGDPPFAGEGCWKEAVRSFEY
jgi:hypothetical protein